MLVELKDSADLTALAGSGLVRVSTIGKLYSRRLNSVTGTIETFNSVRSKSQTPALAIDIVGQLGELDGLMKEGEKVGVDVGSQP